MLVLRWGHCRAGSERTNDEKATKSIASFSTYIWNNRLGFMLGWLGALLLRIGQSLLMFWQLIRHFPTENESKYLPIYLYSAAIVGILLFLFLRIVCRILFKSEFFPITTHGSEKKAQLRFLAPHPNKLSFIKHKIDFYVIKWLFKYNKVRHSSTTSIEMQVPSVRYGN